MLCGCSSRKLRSTIETESTSVETTVNQKTAVQQSLYTRQILVSDSSEAAYKVLIFPVDSFQFSIRDGFKGKATRVEILGTMKKQRVANDRMKAVQIDSLKSEKIATKTIASTVAENKTMWRSLLNWRILLLLLVVGGFVGWRAHAGRVRQR